MNIRWIDYFKYARKHVILITLSCAISLTPQTLRAATCETPVATAHSIQGQVEQRSHNAQEWIPVTQGEVFCPGYYIRVGKESRASLMLNDNTLLRLAENSSVSLSAPQTDDSNWLELLEGVAHFLSRVQHKFQVNTAYLNACIEGTEFTVEATPDIASVTVLEGQVRAENTYGEVLLKGGQKAEALPNQAPSLVQVVDPLDAVQWTLYYPPLTENISAVGRESMEAYRKGDLQGAINALAQMGDVEQNPELLVYRASLQLRVGSVDAARRDLERALESEPDQADALSLLSIIATVQNQHAMALTLAQQAVESSPDGLAPLLALSYAQQAKFQLPEALNTAQQATEVIPNSTLAWSQLARLHLMFRNLDEANEAAQRAVDIAPERAQPLTTLGFVHLASLNIDAAGKAFEKAIRFDHSAAPLPRLWVGRDPQRALG
jgi:tetratricopeptide (TPR) repeat protein